MITIRRAVSILVIVSIVSAAGLNLLDADVSHLVQSYKKKIDTTLKTTDNITAQHLIDQVISKKDLQILRLDLSSPGVKCFVETTCSNQAYNQALAAAPVLLTKHASILKKTAQVYKDNSSLSLSFERELYDSSFLSLNSLVELQLLEINLLFSKNNLDARYTNSATDKAMALDRFLLSSISKPNPAMTILFLFKNLYSLRSSLQKHSPKKIRLATIEQDRVLEAAQIGEFILFSNTLEKALKEKNDYTTKKVLGLYTNAFVVSKNRTLNLFAKTNLNHSQEPCVSDSDLDVCRRSTINHLHPINPVGKLLVNAASISPRVFKKMATYSSKINSLNL